MLQLDLSDIRTPERGASVFDILAAAFDSEGKQHDSTSGRIVIEPSGSAFGDTYETLLPLDVRPGRYQLRIAVESITDGRVGSVFHDVLVPDFSKNSAWMSGVALRAEPPMPIAGTPSTDILAIMPTALREFDASQRVFAFVQIYRPDAQHQPLIIKAAVDGEHGVEVYSRENILDSGHFDQFGLASHTFEIPVKKRAPGAYVLSFELTGEHKLRDHRAINFAVTTRQVQ